MTMSSLNTAYVPTDPSDWPESVAEIRDLDKLLRCPICFEYMTTAMIIPQCSHTYCSLCIRRYIAFKNQCPTCTEPVSEPLLRNNRVMDEIIQKFVSVRSRLLNIVRGLKIANVANVEARLEPSTAAVSSVSTSSCSFAHPSSPLMDHAEDPDLVVLSVERKSSDLKATLPKFKEVFSPKREKANIINDDTKPCPAGIFSPPSSAKKKAPLTFTSPHGAAKTYNPELSHLSSSSSHSVKSNAKSEGSKGLLQHDFNEMCYSALTVPIPITPGGSTKASCTITSNSSIAHPSPGRPNNNKVPCPVCGVDIPERSINLHLDRCLSGGDKPTTRSATPRRKPMPKLVYSLMKDKELKKKLTDAGLPTTGDRQTLIKRHSEFTLQYNAQCDSLQPKSTHEIIKDVLNSDKVKQQKESPSGHKQSQRLQLQKTSSPAAVEEAQKSYVKKHKSQFAQLIAEARKRMEKERAAAGLTETGTGSRPVVCNPDAGGTEDSKIQVNPDAAKQEEQMLIDQGLSSTKSQSKSHQQIVDDSSVGIVTNSLENNLGQNFIKLDARTLEGSSLNQNAESAECMLNAETCGRQDEWIEPSTVEDDGDSGKPSDDDKTSASVAAMTELIMVKTRGEPLPAEEHKMALLESEDQDDEDCCSPSLYSDNNSQPRSSCSMLPYAEAGNSEVTQDWPKEHVLRDLFPEGVTGPAEDHEKRSRPQERISLVQNLQRDSQSADGVDETDNERTDIIVPEISTDQKDSPDKSSPVFLETSSSRKRKRNQVKILSEEKDLLNVSAPLSVNTQDNVMEETSVPPVKHSRRRARRKAEVLLDVDALYEAYAEEMMEDGRETRARRVTRSRARHSIGSNISNNSNISTNMTQ